MKNLALILLLPLFVTACGVDDILTDNKRERETYETESDFDRAFRESDVSCSGVNCPDSIVGMYFISNSGGRSLGSCSGTYIGNNRILTNAHCVPKDLQYRGKSCSGRIMVNFPANGRFGKEKYECAQIETMIKESEHTLAPDWAVLQFTGNTSRTPSPMDFNGIPHETPVTIYKVNFRLSTSVATTASVYKTECIANGNDYYANKNIGPNSMIFTVDNCDNKIIGGNSGSGVFNSAGQVVGVLSYTFPVKESNESWARKLRARYPKIKQNVGGGTNLACVDYLNPNPVSVLCSYGSMGTYRTRALLYQELRTQLQAIDGNTEILQKVDDHVKSLSAENVWKVKWTDNLSSIRSHVETDFTTSSGERQLRFLFEMALLVSYPQFPSCVEGDQPSLFEVSVPFVSHEGYSVDEDTFVGTAKLKARAHSFRFNKQANGKYLVRPNSGSFFGRSRTRALKTANSRIELPVCQ